MRLYGAIEKVEPQDDGTVRVHGIATTEAEDDQGEIVRAEAIRAALPDYMRFPAIREMHQLAAAGTALEVAVGDDDITRLVAHVVDPVAVAKIKNQVYRGFSIGGRVTKREAGNPRVITGLVLNEISLVDRPANPEAVFDCWKASAMPAATAALFNAPFQTWACGIAEHLHLAKADAAKCIEKRAAAKADNGDKPYGDVEYADPGYQEDGKKRYPLDNETHIRAAWNYINKPKNAAKYTDEQLKRIKAKIIAAWKKKIDPDGPAAADKVAKHLMDTGRVAELILQLDWLKDALEVEAVMEGDDSLRPAELEDIIARMCMFLRNLVAEETGEIESGEEMDTTVAPVAMAAKGGEMNKRSDGDQHLMDVAHAAITKALAMDGMTAKERGHMVQAREAMKAAAGFQPMGSAGAADEHSTIDTAGNPERPAPMPTGSGVGSDPTGKSMDAVLGLIEAALGKRSIGHQHLMDVAHACVGKLTDGATCKDDAGKAAARHTQETMDHLHQAHYHLCAAGAKCDAAGVAPAAAEGGLPDEHQGTKFSAAAAALAKVLSGQGEALTRVIGTLDQLAKDVATIKATPLPPLAVAKTGPTAVDKTADGGAAAGLSDDDIVKRFAAMSPEEQTLALIKASYRNPYRPTGLSSAAEIRGGETR
jgi:hypothetical protein